MANGKARPLFALGEWGRHSQKRRDSHFGLLCRVLYVMK